MIENNLLRGETGALKRALYKSMGFSDSQLQKPVIAIANSYTNATPGHYILDQLCEQVKSGILAAGGTPMVFSTVAPCDGIAEGHEGMRYIPLLTVCMWRQRRSSSGRPPSCFPTSRRSVF